MSAIFPSFSPSLHLDPNHIIIMKVKAIELDMVATMEMAINSNLNGAGPRHGDSGGDDGSNGDGDDDGDNSDDDVDATL